MTGGETDRLNRARAAVRRALRPSRAAAAEDAGDLPAGRGDLVRQLPPWASGAVVLEQPGTWWVYVERRQERLPEVAPGEDAGAAPAAFEPGQVVLDLPAGRYGVETMDVEAVRWTSVESAAGGPLVAGLACSGRAALLRISRWPGPSRNSG